jgi:hypothetical protein
MNYNFRWPLVSSMSGNLIKISLTYLLTELSPSWGAANCAATQELPSILWNPKVQYRVPIHTIPSYLSKIHFNIVHPRTTLSKKYPTLFFPTVSNGGRMGKLSIVVEGTFMRMHDILLPCNTAGCVCSCQIAKLCNKCSSHSIIYFSNN